MILIYTCNETARGAKAKREQRLCKGKEKAQIRINNLSLFQRLSSVALVTKGNLCLVTSRLERVRGRGQRLEVLAVGLLCLFLQLSEKMKSKFQCIEATHVGKTAVGATAYLGLVDVDENARVAEGTAAAVALDRLLLDPADGLFVDELDGCQWARLYRVSVSAIVFLHLLRLSNLPFFQLQAYAQFLLFNSSSFHSLPSHLWEFDKRNKSLT